MRSLPVFANVAEGIHAGTVTRTLASAVTTRYLLAQAAETAGEVEPCAVDTAPVGLMTDTGDAGDAVALDLLGNTATTLLMVAAGPIQPGAQVFTAAGGKVQALPAAAATLYQVGRALTEATAANQLVEVEPMLPRRTALINALSTDPVTAISLLRDAFADGVERIVSLPLPG
ncbi:MAG: hypothetical protein ACFB21_10260 [Opitutales bacterium]